MTIPNVEEREINIVAEGTRLEGKLFFDGITRVHGTLSGEIHAGDGSTLILGESALVEGKIHADHLIIDGFVRGTVQARTKVQISGSGRVVGDILSPSLQIDFGAYFEGRCNSEGSGIKASLEPSPA